GGSGTANEPNVTIRLPGSQHAIPFTLLGPFVSELGLGRGSSVTVTISRLAAAELPAPAGRVGRASESGTGNDRVRDNAQSGDDADTGGGAFDNGSVDSSESVSSESGDGDETGGGDEANRYVA
ncbi:unnamed protein product, partial [Ectocarpus sp. 12 AP-2014]